MEAVVLVIHLIVALAIIAIVLVQPSESGGFMGNSGSMSNMMAPRRSGDVLTRLTAIFAGVFFVTSLTLAIMAERGGASTSSILDVETEKSEIEKYIEDKKAPVSKTAPAAEAQKPAAVKKEAPKKEKQKPQAPVSQ